MLSSYQSVFRPGLFAGQVAIVTGGGSGIGRCTAHELASLGAKVALIGRKSEKLDSVKTEIAKAGGDGFRRRQIIGNCGNNRDAPLRRRDRWFLWNGL